MDLSDASLLISDIKHKKIINSYDIVLRSEKLLKNLIAHGPWKNARELMELIKIRIKFILESLPQEVTATNIMRHILKVIRDEYEVTSEKKGEGQSLHQLVSAQTNQVLDYSENPKNLKTHLLDHLTEYQVELESRVLYRLFRSCLQPALHHREMNPKDWRELRRDTENIASQASEHIHMNEIILTVGKSKTVEKFLKSASKKRSFTVIVVESAPLYYGHQMAASLAKGNIHTIIIPDTAVFAMMSRVNKVIIGTHTVLANGGLRTATGNHVVALAANHYSVPVMVLSHMYKFTPIHVGPHEHDTFHVCASPANVLSYSIGALLNKVDVYCPIYDYVPPELVTLFISHQGGNAPSYVYRLLSELYHPDDYDI